jgi:hypothetical protein
MFFGEEDQLELYHLDPEGCSERYQAPFFNALREYAKQPTGVFHALPLARGKSIMNSNWIGDLGQFYGMNLFMAETSATSGGLDSLLDPTSSLKLAQEYAARAFGARRTFFATNGTSTANKIVVQAWSGPTTSSWWTATATSRTTTAWSWPAPRSPTSRPIRCTSTRCTARCRSATSRKRCSSCAAPER